MAHQTTDERALRAWWDAIAMAGHHDQGRRSRQ